MKKTLKLFLSIALFNATLSFAMAPVKLPAAAILKERVSEIISNHFVEKTELDQFFGDRTMPAALVVVHVNNLMQDYMKQYPMMNIIADVMEQNRPKVIKAILQESPEVIAYLDKEKLLEDTSESESKK